MKTLIVAFLALSLPSLSFGEIPKNVFTRTVEVRPNCIRHYNTGCYRLSEEIVIEDEKDYFVTAISMIQHSDITFSINKSPIANDFGKIISYPIGKGKTLKSKILEIYTRVTNSSYRTNFADLEVVIHTNEKDPYDKDNYSLRLRMDSGERYNKFYINLLLK